MIKEIFARFIKISFYKIKNRRKCVKLGRGVKLGGFHTEFEGYNKIGCRTSFSGKIGRCSYIGYGCEISAEIGRYCSIASYVKVAGGNHPTRQWVSTSPVFFSTMCQCGKTYVDKTLFDEMAKQPKIGNDVWIGYKALLIGGIEIGNGAIVAAGAVVTKDVPPYAIVAGVPAKVVRYRFEKEQIEALERIEWWNRSEEWILKNLDKFKDVDSFVKEML